MLKPINWPAIGAVLIPNICGFTGASIAALNWDWNDYRFLERPRWIPPIWFQAPIWATCCSSVGYGSYLVYAQFGKIRGSATLPLLLYSSNIALNIVWPYTFFVKNDLKWTSWTLALNSLTAIATVGIFHKINQTAGLAFVPYALWLILSTVLSFKTYQMNQYTSSTGETYCWKKCTSGRC